MTAAGSRIGWFVVCILPRRLASYLLWNVRLPTSWLPYICGRALGREAARVERLP